MSVTTWAIDDWTGYQGYPTALDDTGVEWIVVDDRGWRGTPAPRLSRGDRSGADGEWDGESYLAGRVVELAGWLVAPDTATRNTAMDQFAALLGDGSALHQLVVTEEGVSRLAWVRRSDATEIAPISPYAAQWSLTIFAPDPRRYASDSTGGGQISLSTGLPTATSGLTVPEVVPAVIAAGGASGSLAATNAGTASVLPVLYIAGPVTNPRIENLTLELVLDFDIVLGSTDTLVVVPADGSVSLGTASERQALTSASDSVGSFRLAPGQNSLTYRADSSPGGTTLTVVYRAGYL
jgi:hypothetical protein